MVVFELGSCSLGCVLVAMSEKGVCAIAMDDEPAQLTDWLLQKYPHAERRTENSELDVFLGQVLNYVEQPDQPLDLPLDINGTAFQKQVWQALRTIPAGMTHSYAELAEMIGQPQSVRAVATACAANTLALAIPCHRVIRKDGSLSGYRWGVGRKKILLQNEARC